MTTVGLLFPLPNRPAPTSLGTSDFDLAALLAKDHGIRVAMGSHVQEGRLGGCVVEGDRWVPVGDLPVHAWIHRFPDGDRPDAFADCLAALGGAPLVNPPDTVRTCRDKLTCQRVLEAAGVPQPPVVHDGFDDALHAWGTAFLKPRFGAFGRGVTRIRAGDALPSDGDWILQQAIAPPDGWAGISLRVLVQRDTDSTWVICPPVARRSADDPVVNRARGAEVVDAHQILDAAQMRELEALAHTTATALAEHAARDHVGELGIDIVVGDDGRLRVIEVNGKPRGRLAVLASQDPARFTQARRDAVLRPIRFAASLVAC